MYKVYVDVDEKNVHTNALEFDTVQAAIEYARDLYSRWMLTVGWFVLDELDNDGEPRSSHIDGHQAWLDCVAARLKNGAEYIPTASDAVAPRDERGEHPVTLG